MSEEINNREYRQKVIQELLSQLHSGKSVDEVKQKFAETFSGVSAAEISEAEQALIAQGLPVAEVQRLCDVHAAVFKGSIEEIHRDIHAPWHPAEVMKQENRAVEQLIETEIRPQLEHFQQDGTEKLADSMEKLQQIDRHYLKKENVWFPYMERYGITAPPKVMWGVDDEIRAQLKDVTAQLKNGTAAELREKIQGVLGKITDMIFKEENIMMPMLTDLLTPDEWKQMAHDSREFGFCLIAPVPEPGAEAAAQPEEARTNGEQPDDIVFPTGVLKKNEIIALLDTLPIDITFVDKNGNVRYFSQNAERVFPRTKSIIGRSVSNCHPPASVAIVEKIVEDLKAGKKITRTFGFIWATDMFIFVTTRFAVRKGNTLAYWK